MALHEFDIIAPLCYTNAGWEDKSLRVRRDGRVDYGDGLENRCGGNLTGGSNPSPSAKSDNIEYPISSSQPGEMPEWTNGTAC